MIISKGSGDSHQVLETETRKVVADTVILTPYTERDDYNALREVYYLYKEDSALDKLMADCNRFWAEVDETAEVTNG